MRVSRLEKVVGDIFRSHPDPKKQSERVGTVDILEHIHVVYAGVIFSLVLGTDTFYDLIGGKWKRWENILQMVELHVFSRSKPVHENSDLTYHRHFTTYAFFRI